MKLNRRNFLQSTSVLSAAAVIPTLHTRGFGSISEYADLTGAENSSELMSSDLINQCVLRAVDVAKSAGASFADARITRSVGQLPRNDGTIDTESITFGVRAYVNGVYGFAASPFIDVDEAAFLAQSAVSQAKINSQIFPRNIELGSYPAIKGEWSTPIKIDPFKIPVQEKGDFLDSLQGSLPKFVPDKFFKLLFHQLVVTRLEKVVATTEGSLYKQTLYETGATLKVTVQHRIDGSWQAATAESQETKRCGAGWELYAGSTLHDHIPSLVQEAEKNINLYSEPVQVGKYDVIISADVASAFVASTFGDAAQLDRIAGYEANAGGTSYLGPDYLSNLGTSVGSPEINIRADRSMHRGLATTKWDDEGVETKDYDLVKDGKLIDYHTGRDMSGFMSEWYKKQNREVRSNGCSRSNDGVIVPMIHTPNLTLMPGNGAGTFEEMVASTKRGVAFIYGNVGTDFQYRTGAGNGFMRDIRDGVLGPVLTGAQVLFDSRTFWKSVKEVGNGAETSRRPVFTKKGEPEQSNNYTVQSVPLRVAEMAVVDGNRKA